MLKRKKSKFILLVGLGLVLATLLTFIPAVNQFLFPKKDLSQQQSSSVQVIQPQLQDEKISPVLNLTSLPAHERSLQLKSFNNANTSIDGIRSSYILASDYIVRGEGKSALVELKNVEEKYPLLSPYILLREGQAYQLEGDRLKAEASWQKILTKYPDSFAAAEALYLLGKTKPTYWEEAVTKFANYPRTHEIVRQLLQKNPDRLDLMKILVQYAAEDSDTEAIRDRLVKKYANKLTAKDWSAIADGYWDKFEYGKAANAYIKTSPNSHNLYRTARSLQLSRRKTEAKKYYQKLVKQYPNAEETGLGLRRLASISPQKEAFPYLDLVDRKFPKEAAAAMLSKAELWEKLKNTNAATSAYGDLLTRYPRSEAAAEYRWKIAKKQAEDKNLAEAWRWAQALVTDNPDSKIAPRASFWIGKWAAQLNRKEDAQTSFKYVLDRYPDSYYAWRSAKSLNWDVGDFTSVRQINPIVQLPTVSFIPPAGSEIFKELYSLGQPEAWNIFAAEISGKESLTVEEQYTSGLLQLSRGNNLKGINLIWNLQDREEDSDRTQWQLLRQKPEYWYSLFPFPYNDTILKWSGKRQLNPLLVTSLIRQESRFEAKIRSLVGAIGLMQVMPETAKTAAKQINLSKYSLFNPEDNINIGTYYLDFTHRRYDNNSMLAVASYNAGPHRVAKWVDRFGLKDLDYFVEKIPFSETQGYVESVFANYWNYLRLYNPEISQLFATRKT
jgi:soluble lytic murein transglycosylase